MSLQSWIDDERASGGVHGSNQLGILDILNGKLTLIIPMFIISVLTEKGNSVLGVIRISGWHVHIINEVNELTLANWSKSLTSLFLKHLL